MPFILDDEKVDRPVFADMERLGASATSVSVPRARKFSRPRKPPTNLEAQVRLQTLSTSKAKARKGAADIPGLVKQALEQ
jgi:hypothetical protein